MKNSTPDVVAVTRAPKVPVKISFHGMPSSEGVKRRVFMRVRRLERFFRKIISCEVTLSAPHRHHRKGRIFHVNIHLSIPGKKIVVDKEAEKNKDHENAYVALRDAFDILDRKLEDAVKKLRHETKRKRRRTKPLLRFGFLGGSKKSRESFDTLEIQNPAYDFVVV